MVLRELLVSPPGTGKTTYCINLFKTRVLESTAGIHSASFFILPSREHADRIQNLVLKENSAGLFNIHVLTIHEFTARWMGGMGKSHPTDTIRLGILKKILDDTLLDYFAPVKELPGFRRLFLDSIKEFKAGLLTVREFERLSQGLLKDPLFKMKFKDFSVCFKKYNIQLKALGLEEPEDAIAHLVKNERQCEKIELVIFDGFYHFTHAQSQLLAWLAEGPSDMVITLTLPEEQSRRELFGYAERTLSFLKKIGFKENKEKTPVNHRASSEPLRHLEANLFAENPRVYPSDQEDIRLFGGSSLRSEVEMIAREIKKIYLEKTLHFSDIALILRSVSSYEKTIESVFDEFDIPVHVHERKKLIEHSFAMTLYRFLNFLKEDESEKDLLFILKSSYFPCVTEDEALQSLLETKEKLLKAASAGAFEAVLSGWIETLKLDRNDPLDTEVFKAVEALIDGCHRRYRRNFIKDFSAKAAIEELRDAMLSGLFSLKPSGKNRVQVYDVVMALPKEYKIVFMGGLLEGSFPAKSYEDPLFKDSERRKINKKQVVLEERVWRLAGERYFFYMGVTRAKERLYLTYPLYDAEGRPALPSFFIEEARKCFRFVSEVKKDLADFLPEPSDWATPREVSRGLAQVLFEEVKERKSEIFPIFNEWIKRDDFQAILKTRRSQEEARLTDPKILKILHDSKFFSASQLETYATCAFKHFAGRVLKLSEPAEDRHRIIMGNILHGVLENFYKNKEHRTPSTSKDLLDEALKENPFGREPLYRQRLYRMQMLATLERFMESEKNLAEKRDLKPSYFELTFKGKELSIDAKSGPAFLRGIIDRIDLNQEGNKALVIDYKLATRWTSVRSKLAKGLEFQLPIYLMAVRKILKKSLLGAELRFLEEGSREGLYEKDSAAILGLHHATKVYGSSEFEEMLKDTEELIRRHVDRLRGGDIAVRSKTCDNCSFYSVCRFEKWKAIYG